MKFHIQIAHTLKKIYADYILNVTNYAHVDMNSILVLPNVISFD